MPKYRIIQKGNTFIPQERWLFAWNDMVEPGYNRLPAIKDTLIEAMYVIDFYNRKRIEKQNKKMEAKMAKIHPYVPPHERDPSHRE